MNFQRKTLFSVLDTSLLWGSRRIDHILHCPRALTSISPFSLPNILHASYLESEDVAAFILRYVTEYLYRSTFSIKTSNFYKKLVSFVLSSADLKFAVGSSCVPMIYLRSLHSLVCTLFLQKLTLVQLRGISEGLNTRQVSEHATILAGDSENSSMFLLIVLKKI